MTRRLFGLQRATAGKRWPREVFQRVDTLRMLMLWPTVDELHLPPADDILVLCAPLLAILPEDNLRCSRRSDEPECDTYENYARRFREALSGGDWASLLPDAIAMTYAREPPSKHHDTEGANIYLPSHVEMQKLQLRPAPEYVRRALDSSSTTGVGHALLSQMLMLAEQRFSSPSTTTKHPADWGHKLMSHGPALYGSDGNRVGGDTITDIAHVVYPLGVKLTTNALDHSYHYISQKALIRVASLDAACLMTPTCYNTVVRRCVPAYEPKMSASWARNTRDKPVRVIVQRPPTTTPPPIATAAAAAVPSTPPRKMPPPPSPAAPAPSPTRTTTGISVVIPSLSASEVGSVLSLLAKRPPPPPPPPPATSTAPVQDSSKRQRVEHIIATSDADVGAEEIFGTSASHVYKRSDLCSPGPAPRSPGGDDPNTESEEAM